MKKGLAFLLTAVLVFGMAACGKTTDENGSTTLVSNSTSAVSSTAKSTTTVSTTAETVTDDPSTQRDWITAAIPKLGIKIAGIKKLDNIRVKNRRADVVVALLETKFEDGIFPFIPLVAIYDNDTEKLLTYKPYGDDCAYGMSGYYVDLDGDGYQEILVQICAGMSGGAGSYCQSIIKYSDGKIVKLMDEDWLETGFKGVCQDGYKLKIYNKFTGYEKVLDLKKHESKDMYFDENGKVLADRKGSQIGVDSFFTFMPIDIDYDGTFEIQTMQYTSLCGHSDYIGTACSILKYDNKSKSFKVIKAKFLLKSDENKFADGWWGK